MQCTPLPPAENITKLIRQTFFPVIIDFQLPIFFRNCSQLILPDIFSGNRVTNISGNPCSSPLHITSRCAKLSGNPMELIPQTLFPVTMLPIFPVIPTKLIPQIKKLPVIFLEGGGGVITIGPLVSKQSFTYVYSYLLQDKLLRKGRGMSI